MNHRIAISLTGLVLILTACAGASSPSPSATPAASPTPPPTSSPAPTGPNDGPVDSPPLDPGGVEPAPIEPQLIEPQPGQHDIRPVAVDRLEARIAADGRLIVTASWWSGVEPCHVLDSVVASRDGTMVSLTVREGTGQPRDAMCIEIAVYKATEIDLGHPEPGTYTITADPAVDNVSITIEVP